MHGIEIPSWFVLHVNRDLPGHPQAGALWHYLIVSLLSEFGLKGTKNGPLIYRGTCRGEDIIIFRQVDDIALASLGEQILKDLLNELARKVNIVAEESTTKRFNGADID